MHILAERIPQFILKQLILCSCNLPVK